MVEVGAGASTADVRAALGRLEGERRFVIENVGSGSAFDVRLRIDSRTGKNSPVVESELRRKFPRGKLAAGEFESLQAIITTGTGIHFRVGVSWRNSDGSRDERRFDLSA